MKSLLTKYAIVCFTFILLIIFSCTKQKREARKTDKSLYDEIKEGGYSFYQNGDVLSPLGGSPHGSFKLRFNAAARTVLDSLGELPPGKSFPDGSIIVKEVYNGSNITLYAVMKKAPADINAAAGWLWGEYEPDGKAHYSVFKKGEGCTGCHSAVPNRDLTRTFDLH